MRKFERRLSEIIVENPAASVQTGTQSAFIEGLHPNLFVGIGLAYFTATAHRPTSFSTNLFKLYQWDQNKDGQRAQLSSTPINGTSGQNAPDKWEGTSTLPVIELQHSYVGMGAGDVGRWEVVVTVAPAIAMCEEDFLVLAQAVIIRVSKIVLS